MKEGPPPLPSTIQVGDRVRLREKNAGLYCRMYGHELRERVWTVTFIDHVGRKRLYVDQTPSAIFAGDAVLAYKAQSKARREQLTKMGTKLP